MYLNAESDQFWLHNTGSQSSSLPIRQVERKWLTKQLIKLDVEFELTWLALLLVSPVLAVGFAIAAPGEGNTLTGPTLHLAHCAHTRGSCTGNSFKETASREINREKYTYKIIGAPKTFYKNCPVLYLGLKLTIHVIKSQSHLVRQSL